MAAKKQVNKNSVKKRSTGVKSSNGTKKRPSNTMSSKKTKSTTGGKKKPSSLDNTKRIEVVNRDDSIKRNRSKVQKKSLERRFWFVILFAFIAVAIFVFYFIFEGSFDDASTPAQQSTNDLTTEQISFLEAYTLDQKIISDVEVEPQGPMVFVTYTVPTNTDPNEAMNAVAKIFDSAVADDPSMFEKHNYQVYIVTDDETNNQYPIIGAKNTDRDLKFMDTEGKFKEPAAE